MAVLPAFTLYGRVDCHLCEQMQGELVALQQAHAFTLDWVDIDGDPALVEKYGFFVPVLTQKDRKICHYHLDKGAFLAAFE